MIELTWTDKTYASVGDGERLRTRWFDNRESAEQWAADALLPGDPFQIKERPGQLGWSLVADGTWMANHRQVQYTIERGTRGWCSVVKNYEFRYRVHVQHQGILRDDFTSLDAAMAYCDVLAFDIDVKQVEDET